MLLRPITSGDRDALLSMLQRIEQFKPEEVEVALELIDASIAEPKQGYETIVCIDANDVRGYICTGRTPMTERTYDLYWIAVDPRAQGQGIGKQLVAAFEQRVRDAGGGQVRIETSSQETYANTGGFYERLGFEIKGRLTDFYAPNDDLLIFYRRVGERPASP